MIVQKGWQAYFTTGPNREPVYPFLIAWTMHAAGPGSYLDILKPVQFLLLFSTGLFVFVMLRRCGVAWPITILSVLALGFSPALINSSLSVYSEIAAYLFVLGIVWFSSSSFTALQKQGGQTPFILGIGLAVSFILAALVKSVYEVIFYFCLIPFFLLLIKAWQRQDRHAFKKVAVFLLTIIICFQGAICGYKYLNKKYNGLFVLTDRAAWAFYGTAARREVPLTPQSFGAAVTYKLFEEEGCRLFYNIESCRAWDITTADKFSSEKNYEVMAKFPPQEQNKELLKASVSKIMENPLQYAVLMGLDWVRLFFWESTHIGFVAYPDWLEGIFNNQFFSIALRLVVGMLSLGSFLFCIFHLIRQRQLLWKTQEKDHTGIVAVFFAAYVILCHTMMYSLFFTLPRFALPIAPLFILLIALSAQVLTRKEK